MFTDSGVELASRSAIVSQRFCLVAVAKNTKAAPAKAASAAGFRNVGPLSVTVSAGCRLQPTHVPALNILVELDDGLRRSFQPFGTISPHPLANFSERR